MACYGNEEYISIKWAKYHSCYNAAVFLPNLSGGIAPLFEGIVLGTFLMTGASGAVYLGEETKMPRKNIKKALESPGIHLLVSDPGQV